MANGFRKRFSNLRSRVKRNVSSLGGAIQRRAQSNLQRDIARGQAIRSRRLGQTGFAAGLAGGSPPFSRQQRLQASATPLAAGIRSGRRPQGPRAIQRPTERVRTAGGIAPTPTLGIAGAAPVTPPVTPERFTGGFAEPVSPLPAVQERLAEQPTLRERIAGASLARRAPSPELERQQAEARDFREQTRAATQRLAEAQALSPTEQALQRQIAEETTGFEQAIAGEAGLGRGRTTQLVRGRQRLLGEQADIRLGGLGRALSAETQIRESEGRAAQAELTGLISERGLAVQEAELERQTGDRVRAQQVSQLVAQTEGATFIDRYSSLLNSGAISLVEVPDIVAKEIIGGKEDNQLLSVEESRKLGVPFGTTQKEAFGITPQEEKDLIGGLDKERLGLLQNLQNSIRQDPDIKGFIEIRDSHDRILAAAEDPSAAGDLALIFNFMKVLDPGSTVREGEFATAQNSGGVAERFRAQYNQVLEGERLADSQRNDFVDRANKLFLPKFKQFQEADAFFRNQARTFGIPEELVIRDFASSDVFGLGTSAGFSTEEIQAELESGIDPEELKQFFKQRQGFNGDLSMSQKGSIQAKQLAQAISTVESGGRQVKGASGEFGAFQFLPATWKSISSAFNKAVNSKPGSIQQTESNERAVATWKIDQLLKKGHTPKQVALIWNTSLGGSEKPFVRKGVNKQGIRFDSGAYANNVVSVLNKIS